MISALADAYIAIQVVLTVVGAAAYLWFLFNTRG